ncbi:tryptophan--tRNA ligase [Halobacteriales archaeon QS_3_64_16]|nr:MAG: tryptophan--tRNA ligase [Halobacteriales archaeon QS_3_64_16]
MTGDTDSNRRTDPADDSDTDSKPRARSDSESEPNSNSEPQPQTDGGTATGADETALDPWGSSTIADYESLFERFGIEEFEAVLSEVPDPHYLMRRGVIFGHRDYRRVADALQNGEPAAALSGFMPTGEPHVGHKLVFDELIWHQQQGAETYGLIADLEAHSARGLPWTEIDDHARDYLLSLLALGFDPEDGELYRQSENRELQDLAFELGIEANLSEMDAIYGFDGGTDLSHVQSVVTQMADILYPQLDEPKPTVIPVGPDQDPHVRLARDLAARTRYFGVAKAYASFETDLEERALIAAAYETLGGERADDPDAEDVRCAHAADWLTESPGTATDAERGVPEGSDQPEKDAADTDEEGPREQAIEKLEAAGKEPLRPRVRFLDRNATPEAFEALIERAPGEKRVYEGHIDSFELDREAAETLAREVEIDHGGYGFVPPSSIYHRFMTGLTGGKMSSSVPASHISLLDDPEVGYDKVTSATTGGRETAELQRELGGEAEECPVYELYAYLLAADDDEYTKRVYEECTGGERLCGGCKEEAAELMREFLADHQEKRAEAEELLEDLDIELDSPRR